jgi:drug/metabolite transporter (DMT)-like permease
MKITNNENMLGMMLAAIGFSLYSVGDVFVKFAAENYPPEKVAFFINIFFLPLLLMASSKVGGLMNTLRTKHLKLHIIRSLLGMCVFFAMTTGFTQLGMAMSYTLIFMGPFIVSILAVFFLNEKIRAYRWCAIAAGFTGVLIVLRPGLVPLEPAALGIVGAAFCYAISTIIIRKIGDGEPLLAFSLFGCITSLVLFGGMTVFKGEMSMPPMEHMWFFLGTASFHMFANFAVSRAFQTVDTSIAAPFQYTQLLWGMGAGYLLFNTSIDLWTAVGGAIIVCSGIFMIYREHVLNRHITTGVVAHGGTIEDTGFNTTTTAIAEDVANETRDKEAA